MLLNLRDRVIFITGASRGIGREIALRCAQDGAKIVIAAKSSEENKKLPGTIYSVADEVVKAGGEALPIVVDVRDEAAVADAVNKTIATFGRIDALVNNASAINLADTLDLPMKRFDLIFSVNVRATYLCSKLCIPHLKKSDNPRPKWFKKHLAYTMSKYGMSMCTLGMAAEFKDDGIAVNSLWPKTLIATAAISVNFSRFLYHASRKPAIMADAAHAILTSNSRNVTGNFFVDEKLLRMRGVTNFRQYAMHRFIPVLKDIFVDEE